MEDVDLPVIAVGRKGRYFSQVIETQNRNLYEEFPTFEVAGDVLETMASVMQNPVPQVPILLPNTAPTENIVRFVANIPIRKE